jgi:MFS family permease
VAEPSAGRRTFGPAVLVGVVAGIVVAMAGSEPWFVPEGEAGGDEAGLLVAYTYTQDVGVVTAASALALAWLACWGVLLVTRGRVRRPVAVLGTLTATGSVITVIASYFTMPDDVRAQFEELSIAPPDVKTTGWFWIGAVASVLGLVAWVVAVRWVRAWPEMGRRYDTPADSPPEDLWKALDQGHDPTS